MKKPYENAPEDAIAAQHLALGVYEDLEVHRDLFPAAGTDRVTYLALTHLAGAVYGLAQDISTMKGLKAADRLLDDIERLSDDEDIARAKIAEFADRGGRGVEEAEALDRLTEEVELPFDEQWLVCPHCGARGIDSIKFLYECEVVNGFQIADTPQGPILQLDGSAETNFESSKNDRMWCQSCFREFPVPDIDGLET